MRPLRILFTRMGTRIRQLARIGVELIRDEFFVGKPRIIFYLLFIFLCYNINAQDVSDAERLSKMSYMQFADRVNCDSIMSSLEQRICLNLAFQELDSIVEIRFDSLLEVVENDSLKIELIDYQKMWGKNRHNQSVIISKGFRGHMLGIVYLSAMVNITRRRIEEIEYLIRN